MFYTRAFEKSRFESYVNERLSDINSQINFYIDSLYVGRGYFETTTKSTDDRQFSAYFKRIVRPDRYPGILAITHIVIIQDKNKMVFINAIKNDKRVDPKGHPDFKIYPEGIRARYSVIDRVEPLAGNEEILGLDLYTLSDRRIVLDGARDSGNAVATGKIALLPPHAGQTGLAIFVPIYQTGMPPATVEERRISLQGFLGAIITPEDFLGNIIPARKDMDIEIFDGITATKENLIYDSNKVLNSINLTFKPWLIITKQINFADHIWTLNFLELSSYQMSLSSEYAPLATLLGGIILSFLVSWIFWLIITSRARALKRAVELTEKIQKSEEGIKKHAKELERMNRLMIGRELKMVELKKEIEELKKKI